MAGRSLLLCLAAATSLAACDQASSPFSSTPIRSERVEGKMRGNRQGGEQVRVWRDPANGCQYLLWERRQRGAMTARLKPDGLPMCGEIPAVAPAPSPTPTSDGI